MPIHERLSLADADESLKRRIHNLDRVITARIKLVKTLPSSRGQDKLVDSTWDLLKAQDLAFEGRCALERQLGNSL